MDTAFAILIGLGANVGGTDSGPSVVGGPDIERINDGGAGWPA